MWVFWTHKSAVKHDKLVRDEKQLDTGLIGFLANLIVKSECISLEIICWKKFCTPEEKDQGTKAKRMAIWEIYCQLSAK